MVDEYTQAQAKQDAIRANLELQRVAAFHSGDTARYNELCETLGIEPEFDVRAPEGMCVHTGGLEVEAQKADIIASREKDAAKVIWENIVNHGMRVEDYLDVVRDVLTSYRLPVPKRVPERIHYTRRLLARNGLSTEPEVY